MVAANRASGRADGLADAGANGRVVPYHQAEYIATNPRVPEAEELPKACGLIRLHTFHEFRCASSTALRRRTPGRAGRGTTLPR